MTQEEYFINHPNRTDVPGPIMNMNKYSSVDYWYGPYDSKEEACQVIVPELRGIGLTVGIIEDGEIVEYQWKRESDLTLNGLERKVEDFNLRLELVGTTHEFVVDLNNPIVIPIMITGQNAIQAVQVYQIVNGTDVIYQTIQNVAKSTTYNLNITPPTTVGNYSFKILAIDAQSNIAKTPDRLNYIQVNVKYGSIQASWNFSEINNLFIKNSSTVTGRKIYVTFNTLQGYQITKVSLVSTTHGTNTLTNHNYQLLTNVPLNTSQVITMPEASILSNFEGEDLRILVDYKDSDGVIRKDSEGMLTDVICTLLNSRSITFETKSSINLIYTETPVLIVLNCQTGNGTTLVDIQTTDNSDFNYAGKVTSYLDSSIYITAGTLPSGVDSKTGLNFEFNYNFLVDNQVVSGTYNIPFNTATLNVRPPQEFYTPAEGSVIKRLSLIDTNTDRQLSDDTYYKTNSEIEIPESYNGLLLDLYCKLDKTDKDVTFVKIEGLSGNSWTELAQINDNVIKVGTTMNSFTPINEWKQIGIGYKLQETSKFNAEVNVRYNAIYIDGMLIKNTIPGIDTGFTSFSKLRLSFNNTTLKNSFIYYINSNSDIGFNPVGSSTGGNTIIYNNYKSHNFEFSEPSTLPTVTLTPIDETNINELLEKYTDTNVITAINNLVDVDKSDNTTEVKKVNALYKIVGLNQIRFGTISDGLNKASSLNDYLSPTKSTLFNQTTDLKKAVQKKYGVLCIGTYTDSAQNSQPNRIGGDLCIVQTNTQGTSTLNYSIPNFKFKFLQLYYDTEKNKITTKKVKVNLISGYNESTLTAKADYMDSSHLNNTPTCIYYNNLIQKIKNKEDGTQSIVVPTNQGDVTLSFKDLISPSASNNKLDAILGVPVVIDVNTKIGNTTTIQHLGSFMLNIDKTGDSLGFDANDNKTDPDNEDKPFCLSFEGTSNENAKGLSSRFINSDLLTYISNVDELTNHTSLSKQWCKFFAEGLEYRFPEPESGIFDEDTNAAMPLSHFKSLYKMWTEVEYLATAANMSESEYRGRFLKKFNLLYCMIYFIDTIVFGQTDNLGKNCMFDTWDGDIWYPRPYDLDSELGLDNNGLDEIPSFVEIKPEISLDYKEDPTEDKEYFAVDKIKLPYEGSEQDRYHYSSETTNLWLPFYKNFKTQIETFYNVLRSECDFSAESIIQNAYACVISKLGISQYNQDFNNKYLGSKEQQFAYGNRWTKYKKWITDRFAFCDSFFHRSTRHLMYLSNSQEFTIKVSSPQYVSQSYEGRNTTKLVISEGTFGGGSGGGTQININVIDSQLVSSNMFSKTYRILDAFGTDSLMPYLASIDASQSKATSLGDMILSNNAPNLSTIDIHNSSISSITITPSVKKIVAYGCTNLNISTALGEEIGLLEELDVHDSTFSGPLDLSNFPNLKILNISGATLNGLKLQQVPNLTELTYNSATKFGGTFTFGENVGLEKLDLRGLNVNALNISGSGLKVLDCRKTVFSSNKISVASLENIEHLLFNGCKGLEHLEYLNLEDSSFKFNNLKYLGLKASSIKALGTNNEIFDCSCFPESVLSNLKTVIDNESSTNDTEYDETAQKYHKKNSSALGEESFKFDSTQIKTINNLNWKWSGYRLFYNCGELLNIQNSTLNIISSAESMFDLCLKFTFDSIGDNSTLTFSTDKTNKVTTAQLAFKACNALDYNKIEPILENSEISNFHGIFQGKLFKPEDVINLSKYSNAVDMNSAFSMNTTGGVTTLPNTAGRKTVAFTVSGTLPANVTDCSYMFYDLSNINISDFSTFFKDANNLTSALSVFQGWKGGNNTIKVTNSFFPQNRTMTDENVYLPLNISGLFANSKVYCDKDFRLPQYIKQSYGLFYASTGFTSYTDVTNIWANCDNITDISFAFFNCPRVYASGISLADTDIVLNTTGLFGLSTRSVDNDGFREACRNALSESKTFTFNVTCTLTLSSSKGYFPASGSTSRGMFENRYVPKTNILTRLSNGSSLNRLFSYAITHFDEDIVISNTGLGECSECFRNTTNKVIAETENNETLKYINISINSGTKFNYSFSNSNILSNLITLPSTTTSTEYMFNSCVFENWNGQLPYNYFEACSSKLQSAKYMFKDCMYLKSLQYNTERGLFSNCTNLVSDGLNAIFTGAWHLSGGVPKNIFGNVGDNNLTNLTDLNELFYKTSIFYKVFSENQNNDEHCITKDTFNKVPNVSKMLRTFSNIRCYEVPSSEVMQILINNSSIYNISVDSFQNLLKLSDITGLFQSSSMIPDVSFNFSASLQMISDAFYDTRTNSTYRTQALTTDSKNITNASNAFGTWSSTEINSEAIDSFVQKLAEGADVTGIVYQRKNSIYTDDTTNRYKRPSDLDDRRIDGNAYVNI